jgi:hypothetical protein
MSSRDVTGGLPKPLRRFLQFEQRNLWNVARYRGREVDAALHGAYLPEHGAAFRLPCFRVLRRHLYIYGSETEDYTKLAITEEGGRARVVFPVHPIESERYAELLRQTEAVDVAAGGVRLWAAPTSSTRTLLTWDEAQPERAFFAKVSLCSRALGDRRLTQGKVAYSVGISSLIHRQIHDLPSTIRFFPEWLGLVPRGGRGGGVIFRSVPAELRDGSVILVPLFALMGGGPGYPPVLPQIMERTRAGAREVLEEALVSQFAELWVNLVFDFGLILEAHAQDLLLALSPNLIPLRSFYYRDFEGLTVDWVLRRAKGMLEQGPLPNEWEWFSTYETWGYPMFQLVSRKMMISLFDYVHLVLAELESAILHWQASGAITGRKMREGELTFLFSCYLRKAIREKFGMQEAEQYDIRLHLCRFVKFLMQVRQEVIGQYPRLARI